MKKLLAPFLIVSLLFFFTPIPYARATTICSNNTNTQTTQENVGYGTGTGQQWGQNFTLGSACNVGTVTVYVKTFSSPPDALTAYIYSDSLGLPNTLLCTGTAVAGITSSFANRSSTFTGCSLSSGVQYWLVLSRVTGSTSTYYPWGQDNQSITLAVNLTGVSWIPNAGNGEFIYEIDAAASTATFNFGQWFPF